MTPTFSTRSREFAPQHQISVESLQVAHIEDKAMAFGHGPLIERPGIKQLEQSVGLRPRGSETCGKRTHVRHDDIVNSTSVSLRQRYGLFAML